MLVTEEPLPLAVSDVRVASVLGHKERASGIYVGERIGSFHGMLGEAAKATFLMLKSLFRDSPESINKEDC